MNKILQNLICVSICFFSLHFFSQQATYQMTSTNPIVMTSLGSGTYNKTVFYHDAVNGFYIDLAKKEDNFQAQPINFNINARGGAHPFFSILGNSGNIGIGTSNPIRTLDVVGEVISGSASGSTTGVNAFSVRYGNGSLSNWGSLRSSSNTYMSYGVKASNTEANGWVSSNASTLEKAAIAMGYNGISFLTGPAQNVETENPVIMNEVMKIANNGNIGIGTSNPKTKLEVMGDISLSFDNSISPILRKDYGSPNAGAIDFGDGTG